MSDDGKPKNVATGEAGGSGGIGDVPTSGEVSGTTYGSNVSGSTVGSLAQGDHARAITVVHQGLSFTEAERLFGLLFEQNFPKLAETAKAEAKRRVDEFAATFTRVAAAQQLHTVVLCFLVRNASWDLDPYTWQTFNDVLTRKVTPSIAVKPSNVDLEQIERLGCGVHEPQLVVFSGIWMQRFGRLFYEAEFMPTPDGHEQTLRHESPIGARFEDLWSRLRLDLFRLTKLGIVVAATSCEQVLGESFPLETWIR